MRIVAFLSCCCVATSVGAQVVTLVPNAERLSSCETLEVDVVLSGATETIAAGQVVVEFSADFLDVTAFVPLALNADDVGLLGIGAPVGDCEETDDGWADRSGTDVAGLIFPIARGSVAPLFPEGGELTLGTFVFTARPSATEAAAVRFNEARCTDVIDSSTRLFDVAGVDLEALTVGESVVAVDAVGVPVTALECTSDSPGEVRLAWGDPTDASVVSTRIERDGEPLVLLSEGETEFVDTVLQSDPVYRVVHVLDGGVDSCLYASCTTEVALEFVRGDVNSNGAIDITDAVATLRYLFLAGDGVACEDAADVDDNGALALTDAVALLRYLFQDGERPVEPFVAPGVDPTVDELGCRSVPARAEA